MANYELKSDALIPAILDGRAVVLSQCDDRRTMLVPTSARVL